MNAEEKDKPSGSSDKGDIEEPLLSQDSSKDVDRDSKQPHDGFGYNAGYRPCRDVAFAIIFLILVIATLGLGIFSIVHRNAKFRWTQPAHYDRNQSLCGITGETVNWDSSRILILQQLRLPTSNNDFEVALISGLVGTILLSVPIVVGIIWLLRTFTKQLVYVSLPLFVFLPVALNILWFVLCTKSTECQESLSMSVRIIFFVFIFLFSAIIVWIIFSNVARIELTIQILKTASHALYENLSLLVIVPSLSIILLLFYIPTGFFLAFSYANGKYSPHPDLKDNPSLPCGRGTSRACCVWKTEGWVPAYMVLAIIFLLWTTCIIAQAKVYTISGTIAQWYFAKVKESTLGAVRRSLGHAFSSSFGTVCFSGLVFAFVRLIRSSVDSAKANQDREGIAVSILQCCYDWILQAIEFLTKFTIDFAAITGESFCTSASMTYELLRRNLLSTVFVEVITTRLMTGVVFVVSVVYALAVWGILQGTAKLGTNVYTVTVICWLLLLLVLAILVAIINVVVDTVYICYAMDKDRNVVSKPEAHEVFVLLPVSQEDRPSLAYRNSPV